MDIEQQILVRHFVKDKMEEPLLGLSLALGKVLFKNRQLLDEKEKTRRKEEMLNAIICSKEKFKCQIEAENKRLHNLIANKENAIKEMEVKNKKLAEIAEKKDETEELLMKMISNKEDLIKEMEVKNYNLKKSLRQYQSIFSDINKVMERAEEITPSPEIQIESIISDIISDSVKSSTNKVELELDMTLYENDPIISDITSDSMESRNNKVEVELCTALSENESGNPPHDNDEASYINEEIDSYSSDSMESRNNKVEVELSTALIENGSGNLPHDNDESSCINEEKDSYSFEIKRELEESDHEIISDSETQNTDTETYRNYSIEDLTDLNAILKGFEHSVNNSSDKEKELNQTQSLQKKKKFNRKCRKTSKKKQVKKNKRLYKSCNKCEPCLRPPCDACAACLDLPRNNGPGTLRQKCMLRLCDFFGTKTEKRDYKAKAKKQSKIRKTSPLKLFHCPDPECHSTLGSDIAKKSHIPIHFKDIILKEYKYSQNSPCPVCDKIVKGPLNAFLRHMFYVHRVVEQLLPHNDKRFAFARECLS